MGIPKDEAEYYESELHAGRTVVTVNAGNRRAEAKAVFTRCGAYDMETRGQVTSSSACTMSPTLTSAYSESCPPGSKTTSATRASGNTVQATEEKLNVGKTKVKTGEVQVRKEVHTEHKTIDVPVTREEVVVERRSVGGQPVAGSTGKEEIRIPVSEEQVNVQKQKVVKEEVTVGKRKVQDTQRVSEDLKKEEIKVETKGDAKVRNRKS